ncbi:hypothetical protein ACQPZJ_20355 [Actinoplanes sp. CA-054009]
MSMAPAWRHGQVTAERYASWTEEQCAGIEIVDGMVPAPFAVEVSLEG